MCEKKKDSILKPHKTLVMRNGYGVNITSKKKKKL